MLRKRVSQLDEASALTGAEIVGLVQEGESRQTTIADIATFATSTTAVNLFDFVPSSFWPSIEDGSITTDLTALLQAGIDQVRSGVTLYAPAGRWPVAGLRLDGSTGNKSGISLVGDGPGTHFRKPDATSLTTAASGRANVIEMLSGNDFQVRNLKVEGNKSRGGANPAYGAVWRPSTAYTPSTSVTYTTLPDGTQYLSGGTHLLAYANGARVFIISQSHTSAADIDTDLAAGRVTEVTSQQWDDVTRTGYLGYWDDDNDYAYRHGIYANGTTAAIIGVLIENCEVTDAVYGGIVIGSGPLFASRKYFGADRSRIVSCHAHDNQGSNIGGGWSPNRSVLNCIVEGGTSSGIRFDEGCNDGTIVGCVVNGSGTSDNGGINTYKSHRVTISGNTVKNSAPGVWIIESQSTLVTGNIVTASPSSGIVMSKATNSVVSGNICVDNNTSNGSVNSGIYLTDNDNTVVSGNRCLDTATSGKKQKYGVYQDASCSGNVLTGNVLVGNATAETFGP